MDNAYQVLRFKDSTDLQEIRDFVLAILESPHLAPQVTRLKYDPPTWRPFVKFSASYSIESPDGVRAEQLFRNAIEAQNWPSNDAEELLKRLMIIGPPISNEPNTVNLNPDAVVALILPLLPNLETWEVGNVHINKWTFIWKALERNKDIAARNVRVIPYHEDALGYYGHYAFENFMAFAKLPHLRRVEARGLGGAHIEEGGSHLDIPRGASDVQEIELVDCELGSFCLTKIMDFSRGLRKFTYRTGGRVLTDGGSTVVYGRQLRRAVEGHRKSLRVLDLECDIRLGSQGCWEEDEDDYDEEEDEDEDEEINGDEEEDIAESVKSYGKPIVVEFPVFPHLTHLRIGCKMLMGLVMSSPNGKERLIDWLPPTIEELTIVGYKEKKKRLRGWIEELLEKKDERFPKLKVNGIDNVIKNTKDLNDEEDYEYSGTSAEEDYHDDDEDEDEDDDEDNDEGENEDDDDDDDDDDDEAAEEDAGEEKEKDEGDMRRKKVKIEHGSHESIHVFTL